MKNKNIYACILKEICMLKNIYRRLYHNKVLKNVSFTTHVMLTSQRERVNYLNHNLGLLGILQFKQESKLLLYHWSNLRNLCAMFILINYCQKRTDMSYILHSATRLNHKDFQLMPHTLLNTNW